MSVLIFSYGSNMCLPRMLARVGSAQAIARGYVAGRELRFHKRSVDGSAKADAFYTGRAEHRVWGVVFRICRTEKPLLDVCEYLGTGYDEHQVRVVVDRHLESGATAEKLDAWLYAARAEAIDASLQPYTWYRDFVVAGAKQLELCPNYTARIAGLPAVDDPDRERHLENVRLISGICG